MQKERPPHPANFLLRQFFVCLANQLLIETGPNGLWKQGADEGRQTASFSAIVNVAKRLWQWRGKRREDQPNTISEILSLLRWPRLSMPLFATKSSLVYWRCSKCLGGRIMDVTPEFTIVKRIPRLTTVILIIFVHWSIIQCISLPRPPIRGQQMISSIIRTESQISSKNTKIFSCCRMHKKTRPKLIIPRATSYITLIFCRRTLTRHMFVNK